MSYTSQPQPDDGRPVGQPPSQPYVGQPPQAPQPYGGQLYGQQHGGMQPYAAARPGPGPDQAAALAVLGQKSAGVAAILSVLLVGAGQMYCGRVGRGLAFFGAAVVSGLLTFVLIGFLLIPVVFIWALVDAIGLANRHNALLAHRLGIANLP